MATVLKRKKGAELVLKKMELMNNAHNLFSKQERISRAPPASLHQNRNSVADSFIFIQVTVCDNPLQGGWILCQEDEKESMEGCPFVHILNFWKERNGISFRDME